MMADSTRERKKSKKPSNTNFKQHRLKAWQPILTASTALPLFFIIGVVFIPIGAVLLVASDKVQEKTVEYTYCKSSSGEGCDKFFENATNTGKTCVCKVKFNLSEEFKGDVFMYYGLSNFYQNHRRYVRSRDDLQLNGQLSEKVSSDCDPFAKVNGTTIAPCGAIANRLFNDSFKLTYLKTANQQINVDLSNKDIAWKSDRDVKFQNPSGNLKEAFKGYAKPPNWPRPVYELDTNNTENNGFKNEDFIVWMRTAAFSTFRKLYRKIVHAGEFKNGLPKGEYQLDIVYNFPVTSFDGKKRVILSTTSWIGGKNPFLGIAYITVGILCLVLGASFLIIHLKFGKRPRSVHSFSR
ncbi:cell cycle control protein 50A-like isoform X2 [Stylophora pistillata]|uniref:cell cycle control protein 50A-like isoform X2 n=1 Tax=Stylophora pistillata TaxID=50429 RepID=UPI000C03AF22|nr:cell cycle control protein 50A-like isoform X2 [Stylophora pistillata]